MLDVRVHVKQGVVCVSPVVRNLGVRQALLREQNRADLAPQIQIHPDAECRLERIFADDPQIRTHSTVDNQPKCRLSQGEQFPLGEAGISDPLQVESDCGLERTVVDVRLLLDGRRIREAGVHVPPLESHLQ